MILSAKVSRITISSILENYNQFWVFDMSTSADYWNTADISETISPRPKSPLIKRSQNGVVTTFVKVFKLTCLIVLA